MNQIVSHAAVCLATAALCYIWQCAFIFHVLLQQQHGSRFRTTASAAFKCMLTGLAVCDRVGICSSRQLRFFADDGVSSHRGETVDEPLDATQGPESEILPKAQSKQDSHAATETGDHAPKAEALQRCPEEQIQPFASWAACGLMGRQLHEVCRPTVHLDCQTFLACHGPLNQTLKPSISRGCPRHEGLRTVQESRRAACSIHSQLRHICGLYLQSDIQKLQHAVSQSGLTDVIIDFLTDHYRMSTTLHGLSLQMSRAFAQDATSGILPRLDEMADFGEWMQGVGPLWRSIADVSAQDNTLST